MEKRRREERRGEDGGEGHVGAQIEGYHSRGTYVYMLSPLVAHGRSQAPSPTHREIPFLGHEGEGMALLFTPHSITSLYRSPCQRRVYRTKFSAFSIFSIIFYPPLFPLSLQIITQKDGYLLFFEWYHTHTHTHCVYK
jgi:hypothetical protein